MHSKQIVYYLLFKSNYVKIIPYSKKGVVFDGRGRGFGARPQLSVQKLPLIVFASIRSLQNV